MTEPTLTAHIRCETGVVIVDLEGIINGSSAGALRQAFQNAAQSVPELILLNITKVSYINSTGIALFVGLLKQARKCGCRLAVCGLNDHYWEIFHLTRLSEYMDVYQDEASALQAAAQNP